ncbi:uncharacterized protein LTR77_004181 [Saxophila tyrrhenica]|uniref:Protein phosphatase 4 core regulatory subunit R2 n=1 Tax=Saxophila tyrrhenica TaxID=1690608 RepID=A0AAV9PEY8_9PEZI|nr:hypothetical protein LTR77_004181 [Saxophila tyrrhenica]
MLSSEQILEEAAQDGSLDVAEWPRVLESLLQRLHDIVHNEFPLPSLPLPAPIPSSIDPEVVASTPPALLSSEPGPKDEELPDADESTEPLPSSQDSTKENDAPIDIAARSHPPGFEVNRTSHPVQPRDTEEAQSGTLPPDLLSIYTSSTRTLEYDFAHSPPYTIQRLAELALYPKKHYRFLPAYLRALDRIVSVSSPASDFPLPSLQHSSHGGFLTNGDANHANGNSERDGLGSDESLGGALLTPIPWLRNNGFGHTNSQQSNGNEGEFRSESTETIEGPNGAGSIETVSVTINGVPSATSLAHTSPAPHSPTLSEQSDASSSSSSGPTEAEMREQGAVTQGELLRQEQEAGVIPLSQSAHRRPLLAAGAVAVGRESSGAAGGAPQRTPAESTEDRPPEESPHARGPDEIGMEDMGPQHTSLDAGLDMAAAVGRGRSTSPQPPASVIEPSMVAEAEAEQAEMDNAGEAGKDPSDARIEDEMVSDIEEEQKVQQAREEGDMIVADADGIEVGEREKMEVTGDLGGADAADQTTL